MASLLTGRYKWALAAAGVLAIGGAISGYTWHINAQAAAAEGRAAALEIRRAATAELLTRCDAARASDAAALTALRIEIDVRDERIRAAEARDAAYAASRAARIRQTTTAAARAAATARGGTNATPDTPVPDLSQRRAQLVRDIAAIDAAAAAAAGAGGGQRP